MTRRDTGGLRALAEERSSLRQIVVGTEPRRRVKDGVEILPAEDFRRDLWAGRIAGP